MTTSDVVNNQSCDSSASFAVDQGASVTLANNSADNLEGTNCLEISAGGSPQLIEVGANVTAFNIKQRNFVVWCNYSKGKTAQFLTDSASALRIRCYFGGTNPASTPYAEWDQGGNPDLPFGWAPYYASGTTASRLGNGHNGTTDYDSTVQRVSLILDQANNNSGGNDPPFLTDYWHTITKIQLTGGSAVSPLTEDDILTYDQNNVLGVVRRDRSLKTLILNCGIDVGDGVSNGYLVLLDLAIENDQLSDEVEQEWNVLDGSTLRLGEIETGADSTYAVKGCQLSCPDLRNPNFSVEDGGNIEIYDSKFFRWGEINIGESAGLTGSRALRLVNVSQCEALNLNQAGSYTELEIQDNAQRVQTYCGDILAEPTAFSAVVRNNGAGFRILEDMTLAEYNAFDNTGDDLSIKNLKSANLDSSFFDSAKIGYIA